MIKIVSFLVVSTLFFVACGPPTVEREKRPTTYSQPFKTDSAWIVLEWAGQVYGYASGFLIDKEKGAFYTNKHVSDMFDSLGQGSHKIFFNGKIYNAKIIKTHPFADISLIKITDPFNPSEFPEPAKISTTQVSIGDKLHIEGFHRHPNWVRELDKAEGYDFTLVPILKEYYGMKTIDLDRESEIVLEKLEAVVIKLDVTAKEALEKCNIDTNRLGFVENLKNSTNLHSQLVISKDHRFSFGGLSGSYAKNQKGEIVGISTMQDLCSVEWLGTDNGIAIGIKVYNSIYITPINVAEEIRKYLN